ncbi:hypothetical protein EPI10_025333 [Gossypium australe]|uniref:Uncharacterized protein n=1 Tax=Gossypium australe TaxID=47621 RepID=A0A5B6W0K4_9ROSI|nr:hypothetical protein EPI10_025333 [Gossypium australe]
MITGRRITAPFYLPMLSFIHLMREGLVLGALPPPFPSFRSLQYKQGKIKDSYKGLLVKVTSIQATVLGHRLRSGLPGMHRYYSPLQSSMHIIANDRTGNNE